MECDRIIKEKISLSQFFNWLNNKEEFTNITKKVNHCIESSQKGAVAYMIAGTIVFCASTLTSREGFAIPHTELHHQCTMKPSSTIMIIPILGIKIPIIGMKKPLDVFGLIER